MTHRESRQPRLRLPVGGIVLLILVGFLNSPITAQTNPPPVEIHIKARRFEFVPDKITVKKGQRTKLVLTSEDVDHGFAIEEFGVNVKIPAKQTTSVEFTPDRTGRFTIQCTVYCGDDHDNMKGMLVVVAPADGDSK